MPKWSTTGAAQFVKLIVVPIFGVVMVAIEQQRDTPRSLILAAGMVLIGVLPAGAIEWALSGRRPPEPPAPPTQPGPATEDGSPR